MNKNSMLPADVKQVVVEEQRRQQCERFRRRGGCLGLYVMRDEKGRERERPDSAIGLEEKDNHVDRDQQIRHERERPDAVLIANRNHAGLVVDLNAE
jgi:hypothetical protein